MTVPELPPPLSSSPLDRAVDRAHAALRDVAREAERLGDSGAEALARFANRTQRDLLDAWERTA